MGRLIVQRTDETCETLSGTISLGEAIIRKTIRLTKRDFDGHLHKAFEHALVRDGNIVIWDDQGKNSSIRAALPNEI